MEKFRRLSVCEANNSFGAGINGTSILDSCSLRPERFKASYVYFLSN